MASPNDPRRPLRFDTFELDVRARELRQGTNRIRLQEQPFEILQMMLERPGDVVTRDELRQRLWPNGTFVDFEHSLNAAIKRLRAALGDDSDNPRFVETLPRRGYRFIATLDGAADDVARSVQSRSLPDVRLAVLPFTNLSGDPAQEYFSDGLTEELIAQLGTTCRGRIGIIGRWSSMTFKGTSQRAHEIGDALQVRYLLEGSVRYEGDRLRITARLVEAASETHLWSESYERDLAESCSVTSGRLSVQTDVASRVARALAIELLPSSTSRAMTQALPPAAYQAYLKGRYHWNNDGEEGLDEAVASFTSVIAQEPAFAAGHAALARARISLAERDRDVPRHELVRAEDDARRALALDPELSDAHLAMGDVHRLLHWNWAAAERAYTRALQLNPSNENALRSYGLMLAALERPDEAVRQASRACELDPLCLIASLSAIWVSYAGGDYDGAIQRSRRTIDIDPERIAAHRLLAAALLQSGRGPEAVDALDAAIDIAPDDPVALAWLAHAHAAAGHTARASALLERLRLLRRYVPPSHLALAFTGLGDLDAAFAALDDACVDRDPMLTNLAVEPRFEPLRRDARYAGLLTHVNLEQVTSSLPSSAARPPRSD
jgi:TolB-like protein/Tfp pilus assembly protein PilF